MQSKKTLRMCKNGHKYYKSSDCPTCPVCEEAKKPPENFLFLLASPARRALENAGITSLEKLSTFTEEEILKLHGMGKATIPTLKRALADNGLSLKE
jgi:predicted RecB family nuclease